MPRSCKHRQRLILFICLLLIGAGEIHAATRSRTRGTLKLKVQIVDAVTHKPKSKYFLGEAVAVVFTVTNQGRRGRVIPIMDDAYFSYKLVSRFENQDPETFEGAFGGTAGAYSTPEGTFWTVRAPRMMTLGPGQSVSVTLKELRRMYRTRFGDGYHTLTAQMGRVTSTVSFRVVFDEAKSIPLLEKLAAMAPGPNPDADDSLWAQEQLREIRLPSISGMVTDSDGKPLEGVDIDFTNPAPLAAETRSNGRYYMDQLKPGATYTVTPSLTTAGNFSAEWTFEPASRTITNLSSKLTRINFVGTRVRPTLNVASEREGATARASSTHSDLADMFEAGNVIDEVNNGPWDLCCNAAWVDATPNIYPDWVEITFKQPADIDWINVFTLQDHPENSDDPTLMETFTRDGITDFDVQYWTGRDWKTVPGGAIRGNRNVWRKIGFPTITMSRIRVVVLKALTPYSKIKEIEAIHVNQFPVVKLTGGSRITTGSSFQIHADVSDHDGFLTKYSLHFGDDSPWIEKEFDFKSPTKELNLTPTHTYKEAGTYIVTLRAIDNRYEGSETTMTVTVTDPQTRRRK